MISVVVPVYNVGEFLKDCLYSIVNQTYKDLEIICVNDGSTDNSLEILEDFAKKDDRIIVINQENKGQSAARNKGIDEAKGDFIAFIDSDDWINPDYFLNLHKAIVENDCDIAVSGILRTKNNKNKTKIKYDKIEVFEDLKDKINACSIPKCCYVWNKLYKKEIIKNFNDGSYYEDVLWTPDVIKKAKKIVTVPNSYYYYRSNPSSTVKKKQSIKKQIDSYSAKKYLINFFEENNLNLSKKQKTITKKQVYIGNLVLLKIKEFENTQTGYLFNLFPIYRKKIKKPIIKNNSFIVWEPCSVSHSEVVPGYVKYLLDLGYHVSILVHPDRYKEGLFSRFNIENENVSYNKLNKKEIKEFFKNDDLKNVKGVMVTTIGKLCDCVHYSKAYETFNNRVDRKKLLFVEHEASFASDKGMWKKDLITLRKLNYNNETSVVVNPHYFGKIKVNPKNEITNFVTVGTIRVNKKNASMIVDSVSDLVQKGYDNFKITVIGKGNLKHIPKNIRRYFDIKGRLPFKKMYDEIEKADFFLMPYNEFNPEHIRYNTSGTSGNFQLIYGFKKPCILVRSFASINGFDDTNSILYDKDDDFSLAMEKAINLSKDEYLLIQKELSVLADKIYLDSKENLKNLIEKGANYD